MIVQAKGFEYLQTVRFRMQPGQTLDLGKFELHRAGRLTLCVEGEGGQTVQGLTIDFPDQEGASRPQPFKSEEVSPLPDRILRCYSLPFPGTIRVRISAEGFLPQSKTITVASGARVEVSAILEKAGPRIFF